jgi:hypothetical protein
MDGAALVLAPPQSSFAASPLSSRMLKSAVVVVVQSYLQEPRAMSEANLISEEYRKMQQQLHENPNYGIASVEFAPLVAQVIESTGARELLDYGAGKGRLGTTLKAHIHRPLTIHHYDPAIPAWSKPPEPCALVACIDVLEHIEPALLDNVLDDLERVTAGIGFFTVHTGAAVKHLSDGRNAHLIQRPASWWLPKFFERFELANFKRLEMGFVVIVECKRVELS